MSLNILLDMFRSRTREQVDYVHMHDTWRRQTTQTNHVSGIESNPHQVRLTHTAQSGGAAAAAHVLMFGLLQWGGRLCIDAVGVGIFHCLTDCVIRRETKQRNSISPAGETPPQCSQDPCGDPSHSLRLNSDPPLAKRQNDPRPPSGEGRLTYQVI